MKKLYIETYGCQMNISDSEVVVSILSPFYEITPHITEADLILVNTCSVRDNAEQRIRKRLKEFAIFKRKNKSLLIGLIGCMAERIQEKLLEEEKVLSFIAGPDAYRELPFLIENALAGNTSFNVELSKTETYDNISPIRYDSNGVSAFISIMRGCNNFCSYCVVPFTRGRERSRDPKTIILEAQSLFNSGYKEVTLLGQNVNSYDWKEGNNSYNFAHLIAKVADLSPLLRVRFATSHPKDISNELIQTIANYPNICSYIHLPFQSGSNNMLQRMNRGYTREYYIERIQTIRSIIPHCGLSTDIITGFCGETESDHQDTLALMKEVVFDAAYMFKYSVRKGTKASKQFNDDVAENEKTARLNEIITLQQQHSLESNQKEIGKTFEILVEGESKRSKEHFFGRTSSNKVAVFPKQDSEKGMYVQVKIKECTAATLIGDIV